MSFFADSFRGDPHGTDPTFMRIPGSSALSAVAWLLLRGYAARVYEDPVLSVLSWRDESEEIALAKATEYGLTASILTNNVRTAFSCGGAA
jgi:hypothetical protein